MVPIIGNPALNINIGGDGLTGVTGYYVELFLNALYRSLE